MTMSELASRADDVRHKAASLEAAIEEELNFVNDRQGAPDFAWLDHHCDLLVRATLRVQKMLKQLRSGQ